MVKAVNVSFDYSRLARRVSWPAVRCIDPAAFRASRFLAMSLFSVLFASSLAPCASAQYVGQVKKAPKSTDQLRAIAVLEWTGEEGKPKTCRIVPISIYDGEKLHDASLYMERPQPVALAP